MADDDDGGLPEELPESMQRIILGVKLAPVPPVEPHVTVYSAKSTAKALASWQGAGVNAAADRPWRVDYQHAIEQIAPALSSYTTLAELVRAYYDDTEGASYGDAERVSLLP